VLTFPLQDEEVEVMRAFVQRGGTLIYHVQVSGDVNQLLHVFSNGINTTTKQGNFMVNNVDSHILRGSFGTVREIDMESNTWLDVNDPNATVLVGLQNAACLVELRYHEGTVLFITNFSIFLTNDDNDNDVLISNLLDYVRNKEII